ncbi:hypothetical protein JCM1841_000621 [Sporobolomyces salmonicolor]
MNTQQPNTPTRPMPRRVPFPIYDEDELSPSGSASSAPLVKLPSNHFLAQRPVTPPHDVHLVSPSATWIDSARPDTSSLAAADFDVSVDTGFLPPEEPVQSLKGLGEGWTEMEECLDSAVSEAAGIPGGGVGKMSEGFRQTVRELPRVDLSPLTTLPLLRRAHTVVAHLTHFYMHSTFPSQTVVPAMLAVPLVYTSDKLGLPPILTYADTVLWVWKLTDKQRGLRADNVEITTTFTSSPSERAFFLLSLFSELHGPAILRLMSGTLDEAFFADAVALSRIASYLHSIAALVDELRLLMHNAVKGSFGPDGRESITPATFYWEIRPWFNGGKWLYEGVGTDGADVEMEWGGPSAGQSSLVHAIDLFLGVDHSPRSAPNAQAPPPAHGSGGYSSASPAPSAPAAQGSPSRSPSMHKSPSDSTFMQRMSHYMPAHHRAFLQHLSSLHVPSAPSSSSIPSLRDLAQQHPHELKAAYDTAVSSMKRFRDTHIILATHFIVAQARRAPSESSVHWKEWDERRRAKEAEEAAKQAKGEERKKDVVTGTGGTDLASFLKMCRDRTKEALLGHQ